MGYSKNQDAAKRFLRWITSKDVYQKWFISQQGFSVGATDNWEKDPLWGKTRHAAVTELAARTGRFPAMRVPPTARPPRSEPST